jgi:cell division protein FtsB
VGTSWSTTVGTATPVTFDSIVRVIESLAGRLSGEMQRNYPVGSDRYATSSGSIYSWLTMRGHVCAGGACERESIEAMNGVLAVAKSFLLPAAIGALLIYFCYHALAGDQGLAAWAELQKEEEALEVQIADLEIRRDAIQAALVRLQDRTMDLDYVEEIARTQLSYVRPDEILVSSR